MVAGMPRIATPLTHTQIQRAKAKDREYNLADGGGLALRIRPSGSKQWIFNYTRPFTHQRTNLGFGSFPEVSLKQAREKRYNARILLSQGIDPKQHKDEEKRQQELAHAQTLRHVASLWLDVKKAKISDKHAQDLWRSIEQHVFPKLGHLPIHQITAPNAIDALRALESKGTYDTLQRICQRLNEVMRYAVNAGIIATNPLSGISQAFREPERRNMPALPTADLPALFQAFEQHQPDLAIRCVLEWQLHTMVRPGEATGACWSEIDFDQQVWNIPASRMKKKRPHSVPLTAQALAILELMRPISGHRIHVFPGYKNPKGPLHSATPNAALKRFGFKNTLVAHGFRSIASTTLNAEGFEHEIVEAALAHVTGNTVSRAYNRSDYLERRRKMMEWWSEFIEKTAQNL